MTNGFRAFAGVLQRVQEQGSVVVMGSREAIDAANKERGSWLEITKALLSVARVVGGQSYLA